MRNTHAALLAASLSTALTTQALAQSPSPAPTTQSGGQVTPMPQYPIPYRTLKPEEVKAVADRLLARLEEQAPIKFVDRSGKEVTDLSKPVDVQWAQGPDRKFNPTNYPMGVIYTGLLMAADATGDTRYSDFVAKRYAFIAQTLSQTAEWGDRQGFPMRNLVRPNSLDACGAIGASMARAQRMKVGPDLSSHIARFADYVHAKQFRLDDGTLARNSPFPNSLWADDMYMGVSLLANAGSALKKPEYIDEGAKQVLQLSQRLFVPLMTGGGLYTHALHMGNLEHQPTHFWGRANGWCVMAMAELLSEMPEDHPRRGEVLKQFKAHAHALANCQGGRGMWHQMLDRTDSFEETSCTAMFTYAIARGVNRGWLPAGTYGPVAHAAWAALSTQVEPSGRLKNVCVGTNYADDFVFYYARPATDDQHGYGPLLMAGAEIHRLLKNPKISIRQSTGYNNPLQYREEPQRGSR